MNETTTFNDQIKDLHAQAEARYSSGDLQGARQIWEAILQVAPQDKRAEEGLRLTTLADADWALVEQSTGGTPNRTARIAAVRECLGSGLAGEAEKLAEALVFENPGDAELEALLQEAREAFERSSLTSVALREARGALAKGDLQGAKALCQRVLEIDPRNREAGMLLEQAEGVGQQPPAPEASQAPVAMDLELDLGTPAPPAVRSPAPPPASPAMDLELDIPAPPPTAVATQEIAPPRLPPAPSPLEDDPASVKDLFDAVEEIGETGPTGGSVDSTRGGSPEQDETALLVSRARGELKRGNYARACELASQAMVMAEDPPGAQSVLEQAQAYQANQASQVETLLVDAVSLLEDGHPARAIEVLEQALELVPGHVEVVDYLARAREALATGPEGQAGEALDMAGVSSIPLALDSAHPAPQTDPAPTDGSLLAFENTSPQGVAPPLPPLDSAPISAPSSMDSPPPAAPAGPPLPPLDLPAQATPHAETAEAGRKKGKVKLPRASVSSSGLVRILGSILLLVILGTAGWYGYSWWAEGRNQSGEDAIASLGLPVPLEGTDAGTVDEAEAEGSVLPDDVDAPSGDSAPPPSPRYTSRDVPHLMKTASKALARGEEKEALDLLLIAQELDSSSFEILDRIQIARTALQKRGQAEERIALGKEAFAEDGYEEALRIFYRVPKEYQPAEMNRWIANGWYNLGVRALQAGDVVEATRFFSDSLELSPGDEVVLRAKEVSRRYRRRGLDDAFRIYVSRMIFRKIDD